MLFYLCAFVFLFNFSTGGFIPEKVLIPSSLVPPYITPCNFGSPDFEDCAKNVANAIFENFGKGEALLQISPINRFEIPFVTYINDNFTINCTNAVLHGLDKLTAAYIRKIPNGISTGMHSDRIDVIGDFSIDIWAGGEHLVGAGYGNFSFYDVIYKYNFTWNLIDKLGIKFINIVDMDTDVNNTKTVFQLGETGNPETGHINKVLNAHSMEVSRKMYHSVYKTYMPYMFARITGNLFQIIPYNLLFHDIDSTSLNLNIGSDIFHI